MLIVAIDGLLFDTLPLRATAITEAFAAEGATIDRRHVLTVLPSRSIAEAVQEIALTCLGTSRTAAQTLLDATVLDLVTMRAERAEAGIASHGALLNMELGAKLRRCALVTRVVLRSDSTRHVAERLLILAGLDDVIAFTRCADDHSHSSRNTIDGTSAERSYAHIVHRLTANTGLLGESTSLGVALEHSDIARDVARRCGFDTPDHPEAAG